MENRRKQAMWGKEHSQNKLFDCLRPSKKIRIKKGKKADIEASNRLQKAI